MAAGRRRCDAIAEGGEPCRAAPLRGESHCFWHSAEHQKDAAEARHLGGLRRKREAAVSGAYEFDGLGSVADVRRLLEIAAVDALQLENSVARVRALTAIAQASGKFLETGELERRLADLEATLKPRRVAGRRR